MHIYYVYIYMLTFIHVQIYTCIYSSICVRVISLRLEVTAPSPSATSPRGQVDAGTRNTKALGQTAITWVDETHSSGWMQSPRNFQRYQMFLDFRLYGTFLDMKGAQCKKFDQQYDLDMSEHAKKKLVYTSKSIHKVLPSFNDMW